MIVSGFDNRASSEALAFFRFRDRILPETIGDLRKQEGDEAVETAVGLIFRGALVHQGLVAIDLLPPQPGLVLGQDQCPAVVGGQGEAEGPQVALA